MKSNGEAVTDGERALRGEREIIAGFLSPLAAGFVGALDLSDDCAAIEPGPGQEIVLKCDPVRAGVHFFPDDDPADIAWKALAVNVSDLAAKSARPLCYLMALSFPEVPMSGWMARFAKGLADAQDAFGIVLAGGDTDRADGPLSVTMTVLGEVPVGRMVPRTGASVGDILYVSGTLGDAALGLAIRQDESRSRHWGLDRLSSAELLGRYLRPVPRLGMKAALRSHACAAMDISDGLAKDLGRMLEPGRQSGAALGTSIDLTRLPVSEPFRRVCASDPARIVDAVSHGDDYEVLAAVATGSASAFEASSRAGGVTVTAIGRIESAPGIRFLDSAGETVVLSRLGYDHF